jgi:hypothetical protein
MFAALMGLLTAQNNLRMTQARLITHHPSINNDNNKPKQEEYKPKHEEEFYKPKHAKEEERLVSL